MGIDDHIAIIGAGTMGRGIAIYFLKQGCKVKLIDYDQESLLKAQQNIQESLPSECHGSLEFANSLKKEDSITLVIEAIPEILEAKQLLFKELEAIVPKTTIIASNTSGIPINQLNESFIHKDRFLGMHFYMPAETIPVVEVIKGDGTSQEIIDHVMNWLKRMKKMPVYVRRDIPGFIGNRLQHAMAREAISLLEQGIATAEEIDLIAKYALGIRLAISGPLEQRDLNGLDVHFNIADYLYRQLENSQIPSKLLKDKVEKGELGIKTGKGFYQWPVEAEQVKQRNNEKLLKVLKALQ